MRVCIRVRFLGCCAVCMSVRTCLFCADVCVAPFSVCLGQLPWPRLHSVRIVFVREYGWVRMLFVLGRSSLSAD